MADGKPLILIAKWKIKLKYELNACEVNLRGNEVTILNNSRYGIHSTKQSYICPTCLEQRAYTGNWQCATMVLQLRGKSLDLYDNVCCSLDNIT